MKLFVKWPILLILLIYTFANILMLFNNGVFWDDWCIYKMSYTGLTQLFQGVGLSQMVSINYFLQNITSNSPLVYRLLIFGIELISIVLFYKIASKFISNSTSLFYLTSIFAIIPYNEAKILMCCLQYNIGFSLFLFGCFLFLKRSLLQYRIISFVLFFFSFYFLTSNLVFFFGFLVFVGLYELNGEFTISKLFKKVISLIDFIILPIVFWILRSLFFAPNGIYKEQGYNSVSYDALTHFPINFITTIKVSSIGLGFEFFQTIQYSLFFIFLFLGLSFFFWFLFRKKQFAIISTPNLYKWIFIGVLFFISGAFAYLAVGKVPSFGGYETRHQILLKIGAAIIFVWFILLLKNEKLQKISFILIISSFIIITTFHNFKYLVSWMKQESIVVNLSNSSQITNNITFFVIDNTLSLNETEREYLSYCYNGISKKAFNEQSRFFIPQCEVDNYKEYLPIYTKKENYNCKDYIFDENQKKYIIEINYNKNSPSLFKLMFLYYFSKEKFKSEVKNYISLTCYLKND